MKPSLKIIFVILITIVLLCNCTHLEARRQSLSGRSQGDFRTGRDNLSRQLGEQALEAFLRVVETVPNHVESLYLIGSLYYDKHESLYEEDEILETFKAAYEFFTKTIEAIDSLPNWETYTDQNRRLTFPDIRQDSENKILSIFVRLFTIADEFFLAEEYEIAEPMFEELLVLFPNQIETAQRLVVIANSQGETDKAINYFIKMHEINPDNEIVLINLALEYSKIDDFDNAIFYLQKMIDTHPNDIRGYINIAIIKLNQGLFTEALDYYDTAISINPENIDLLNDAIDIAYEVNLYERAKDYCLLKYEIEDSEESLVELTRIFARLEDWENVRTYAAIWHEMNPAAAEAVRFLLGAANHFNDREGFLRYQEILRNLN